MENFRAQGYLFSLLRKPSSYILITEVYIVWQCGCFIRFETWPRPKSKN